MSRALLLLSAILTTGAHAAPPQPSASSEWGPGYGAAQAADGLSGIEGNYWQTVQGTDRGAWWQLDLRGAYPVRAVHVTWARYQNRIHCPPEGMAVQVSLTGEDGSWRTVLEVSPAQLPRDGALYERNAQWSAELPEAPLARFVRLLFAQGSQPGAKYPGYLCLGEVSVDAPGSEPRLEVIEGAFGRAEVDTTSPALAKLYLRGPDGRLSRQSLLAAAGARPWASQAYTYVVTDDGRRYESRLGEPARVHAARTPARTTLLLAGVPLVSDTGDRVATEDWTLAAARDDAVLTWRVRRRWERDLACTLSGSPGLFFRFEARSVPNSVTTTLWYDPARMKAASSPLYALVDLPGRVSPNQLQTIQDRDTWAVVKLWTNWHAPADLLLRVQGGYLYRRGSFAWLSEVGAVTSPELATQHHAGEVETIALQLEPIRKERTGYQLAVDLPDKTTERRLRDFYGSVLNGGAVNDQATYDLGNESDGWYYAGSSWMYGLALAAGVPAPGKLAAHPYDVARAFRGHLAHIVATLDADGRSHFGYNQGGEWVDDNLHTIIGAHAYLLHTGDLAFIRECLPAFERMLAYFVERRNADGLFRLDDVGAHWYYDAIATSGVNGYYNAFLYRAACDLAEMEQACGNAKPAAEYRALAEQIKAAFNRVLWRDDLPGGPRYVDWIESSGREVTYFCDLCQYPAVAVGIASPEQARELIATADARLADIARQDSYRGYAGLSALWPVPADLNPLPWQQWGVYMNGGSLLAQTYWEVLARARAGDNEGAYERLRLFAQRFARTSWAGDNSFNTRGRPQGDGEPYLADMVVVCAALVNGTLGITPTWDRLAVTPHLPAGWPGASAEVLYKGCRYRVTIAHGQAQTTRVR